MFSEKHAKLWWWWFRTKKSITASHVDQLFLTYDLLKMKGQQKFAILTDFEKNGLKMAYLYDIKYLNTFV